MPTFDTPQPILVSIDLGYHVGDIRITASDRVDTTVEVQPSDPLKRSHMALAEQTLVEYASGTLLVKAPKGWRQWTPWGGSESIDVRIQLPTGSQVLGTVGVGPLHCTGRLGECRVRTGVGDIQIEEAGPLELKAGVGEVTVDVATVKADVKTAGAIRIGRIDGPATIRNSNGDTWIGEVTGEARLTAANGAISVDLARADVAAKSANGAVRLGEVAHGVVVAQSALGAVEIGIRDGVAAWLDLETKFGTVQNDLDASEHPESEEGVVQVNAHTSMGNITIHRSFASATQKEES